MTDHTDAEVEALERHRICNAAHGRVACYCSAIDWMTLDEYAEHIERVSAAREAAARADERERVAAAIEAEAERAHAAFASDEDDHLADMRNRLGITLEPGHWNRHDDGCGMCGMSSAASIARSGVES